MEFLPAVRTTVDSEGKIVVTIHCVSEASPRAVVSWSIDSEAVTNGTTYQISSDTTQLKIRDYNVSNILHQNYTCTCRNPLGSRRRDIQLKGIEMLFLVCWLPVTMKQKWKITRYLSTVVKYGFEVLVLEYINFLTSTPTFQREFLLLTLHMKILHVQHISSFEETIYTAE